MNLISDLYLFSINQIVPFPTHFSQTGVPSIIDIVFVPSTLSSRCAQAKPLLLIEILTNLFPGIIYPALIPIPSPCHYHASNINIPFSCTSAVQFSFNPPATFLPLPKFYYLIPGNNPLQTFYSTSFIINSCTLYLASCMTSSLIN